MNVPAGKQKLFIAEFDAESYCRVKDTRAVQVHGQALAGTSDAFLVPLVAGHAVALKTLDADDIEHVAREITMRGAVVPAVLFLEANRGAGSLDGLGNYAYFAPDDTTNVAVWLIMGAVVANLATVGSFAVNGVAALHTELLKSRNIDTAGLKVVPDGKTFRWHGRYLPNMNDRETLDVQLNVFGEFDPLLPADWMSSASVT